MRQKERDKKNAKYYVGDYYIECIKFDQISEDILFENYVKTFYIAYSVSYSPKAILKEQSFMF